MKTHRHPLGVALVLTLACVVILTVIIVGFLSTSQMAMNTAAQSAAQEQARGMAELAVGMVMSQIRDATLACVDDRTGSSNGHAWASQPGAIRVWDNRGQLANVYKLYSAPEMQVNNLVFLTPRDSEGDMPDDWGLMTGQFVDLNTPVKNVDGNWIFPILNPALGRNAITGFTCTPTAPSGVTPPWNPTNASATSGAAMPVRWLYVLKDGEIIAPDAISSGTVTFRNAETRPTENNPIVGRIAFWTDDETCKININTAAGTVVHTGNYGTGGAVGLTSDSYWDTPMTGFAQDLSYGWSQPAEGEYQRHAGHPATVNMLSVFANGMYGGTAVTGSNWGTLRDISQIQKILDLTPRYKWGGSENGTNRVDGYTGSTFTKTSLIGTNAKYDRLYSSLDELQFRSSMANINVSATRQLNELPEVLNTTSFVNDTPRMLDSVRFFLTARSRASDLNLFGQPRVTIWPISKETGTAYRTVYDNYIAFASTLGGTSTTDPKAKQYVFQRFWPMSQTDDYSKIPRNQALLFGEPGRTGYLASLTSKEFPGYGGSLSSGSSGAGGIQGFEYKYDYGDGAVAGAWAQILTQIFDYVRTIHMNESWSGVGVGTDGKNFDSYTITDQNVTTQNSLQPGSGVTLPIKITTPSGYETRGAGRVPTLAEVALIVIRQELHSDTMKPRPLELKPGDPDYIAPEPDNPIPNYIYKGGKYVGYVPTAPNAPVPIQSALLFDTYSPMFGLMPFRVPNIRFNVTCAATITDVNGLPRLFYNNADSVTTHLAGSPNGGRGGADGTVWIINQGTGNRGLTTYPYRRNGANPIAVASSGSIQVNSGPLTVVLSASVAGTVAEQYKTSGTVSYQTLNLIYPTVNLPIPAPCSYDGWTPIHLTGSNATTGEVYDPQDFWLGPVPWGTGAAKVLPDGRNVKELQVSDVGARYDWGIRYSPWAVAGGFGFFFPLKGDVMQSIIVRDGDYRQVAYLDTVHSGFFVLHTGTGQKDIPFYVYNNETKTLDLKGHGTFAHSLRQDVGGGFGASATGNGNNRMFTGGTSTTGGYFVTGSSVASSPETYAEIAHLEMKNIALGNAYDSSKNACQGDAGDPANGIPPATAQFWTTRPKIDPSIRDLIEEGWTGDWENGPAWSADGSYLRKSDEGTTMNQNYFTVGPWSRSVGFFAPNREVPSAGMFGGLPTGVKHSDMAYRLGGNSADARPWRTLLFCPNPDLASSPTNTDNRVHFGFGAPEPFFTDKSILPTGSRVVPANGFSLLPDRLLLDLFTMPIVEPYPISDSFSTAGRINMNQQIVPFTGIVRETGLYAVLSSQRLTAIPNAASRTYKSNLAADAQTIIRHPLNVAQTIQQFKNVFAPPGLGPQNGDIFHSPSDICALYLVPIVSGGTVTLNSTNPVAQWWRGYRTTGDNLRERPYTYIYPLFTTKSNTYTVHVWAQAIKKVPSTPDDVFVEGRDKVTAEYRGRSTIERYLDPKDSRLYADLVDANDYVDPDVQSLEPLYRYRVLEAKQFNP